MPAFVQQIRRIGVPNLLTLSRLLLLGPIAGALYSEAWKTACALFVVAAATDWLDGWVARRFDCATAAGVYLDPLVDKVVANVLLALLAVRFPAWIPPALFLPLLAREFIVQGFRSIAPCKGVLIRTGFISKSKFALQAVAVAVAFAGQAVTPGPVREGLRIVTVTALAGALLAGLVSMVQILAGNSDIWQRPTVDLESR